MLNFFSSLLILNSLGSTIKVPEDYASISSAINYSTNNDTISIAAGTYYENSISFLGKDIIVTGRFPNDSTYIKSVKINGTVNGNANTIFLFNSNEPKTSTLQGVTLFNVVGAQSDSVTGGGVYFDCNSSGIVRNCYIRNNRVWQGGGIYIGENYNFPINGEILIENCVIKDNFSYWEGGGVAIAGDHRIGLISALSNIVFKSCSFISNKNGAIHSWQQNFVAENCKFIGNKAKNLGGAIKLHFADYPVYIKDSVFDGNIGSNFLYLPPYGSAIYCMNTSLDIKDCVVKNNSYDGEYPVVGTIVFGSTNLEQPNNSPYFFNIERTEIINNSSLGVFNMYMHEDFPFDYINFNNILIKDNNGASGWGGFYNGSGYFEYNLTNCIIENNSGNEPIIDAPYQAVNLENTIIWNNGNSSIVVDPDSSFAQYSNIEDGWNYNGGNNMNLDPILINYGNCKAFLDLNSPCIDTGNPSINDCIEWPASYSGERSDMGIYGGQKACYWDCLD